MSWIPKVSSKSLPTSSFPLPTSPSLPGPHTLQPRGSLEAQLVVKCCSFCLERPPPRSSHSVLPHLLRASAQMPCLQRGPLSTHPPSCHQSSSPEPPPPPCLHNFLALSGLIIQLLEAGMSLSCSLPCPLGGGPGLAHSSCSVNLEDKGTLFLEG